MKRVLNAVTKRIEPCQSGQSAQADMGDDMTIFLCPVIQRSGTYCSTIIHLSVTNLTCKFSIFLLFLNYLSCKAHIWYEGTSHRYTSAGTMIKVLGQGQNQL